jgi:hypothetical protein
MRRRSDSRHSCIASWRSAKRTYRALKTYPGLVWGKTLPPVRWPNALSVEKAKVHRPDSQFQRALNGAAGLRSRAIARDLHLVWAGLAIGFAVTVALFLAAEGPFLETCAQCGTTLGGTICDTNAPDGCGAGYAYTAALLTILTGVCALFALHAVAVLRSRPEPRDPSLLLRKEPSGPALLQVASVAVMTEGALLAFDGLLIPWIRLCIEPCLGVPALTGVAVLFVTLGGLAAVGGAALLVAASGASPRGSS